MVDLLACGLFMIGLVQYKEYVSVPYGWLAYLCLYYGDTYNAERQSVALGVAFLAFSFVWKKKYHWAVLLLAVSCLFHNATFISFGALLIYILLQHFDTGGSRVAWRHFRSTLPSSARLWSGWP